jgi:hypothetical protein
VYITIPNMEKEKTRIFTFKPKGCFFLQVYLTIVHSYYFGGEAVGVKDCEKTAIFTLNIYLYAFFAVCFY